MVDFWRVMLAVCAECRAKSDVQFEPWTMFSNSCEFAFPIFSYRYKEKNIQCLLVSCRWLSLSLFDSIIFDDIWCTDNSLRRPMLLVPAALVILSFQANPPA